MNTSGMLQSPQKLTSAQLRKIKKPIIEKRRRERINDSLNQLKALVLEALDKDESQYNKMEKADILEMTVKHLRCLQRQVACQNRQQQYSTPQQQQTKGSSNTSPNMQQLKVPRNSYQNGYSECAEEVRRYLGAANVVSSDVQTNLSSHLQSHFVIAASPSQVNDSPATETQRKRGDSISSSRTPSPASSLGGAYSPISRDSFTDSPLDSSLTHGSPVFSHGLTTQQNIYLAAQSGQVQPVFSQGQTCDSFVPIVISPMATTSMPTSSQSQQGIVTPRVQISPHYVIPLYHQTTVNNAVCVTAAAAAAAAGKNTGRNAVVPATKNTPVGLVKNQNQQIDTHSHALSSDPVWRPW